MFNKKTTCLFVLQIVWFAFLSVNNISFYSKKTNKTISVSPISSLWSGLSWWKKQTIKPAAKDSLTKNFWPRGCEVLQICSKNCSYSFYDQFEKSGLLKNLLTLSFTLKIRNHNITLEISGLHNVIQFSSISGGLELFYCCKFVTYHSSAC